MSWDARLEGRNAGDPLTYELTPVCGTAGALHIITMDAFTLTVVLPRLLPRVG